MKTVLRLAITIRSNYAMNQFSYETSQLIATAIVAELQSEDAAEKDQTFEDCTLKTNKSSVMQTNW